MGILVKGVWQDAAYATRSGEFVRWDSAFRDDIDRWNDLICRSQIRVNPTGIVPLGPRIDFSQPHGREVLGPGT